MAAARPLQETAGEQKHGCAESAILPKGGPAHRIGKQPGVVKLPQGRLPLGVRKAGVQLLRGGVSVQGEKKGALILCKMKCAPGIRHKDEDPALGGEIYREILSCLRQKHSSSPF